MIITRKQAVRFLSKMKSRVEGGIETFRVASMTAQTSGGDLAYVKEAARQWANQIGAVNIDIIIMVFVAFMILFQFIPIVSDQNAVVQSSDNVTTMGKFAAGLGEWMFPLFGILGLVFLLWRQKRSGKGGT